MSPVWLFLLWLEFFWKTSKSAYWDNVGVGSRNVYASCKPNQSTNWFNMHCELKQQPVKLSCKLVRRNSEEVLREIMAACRLPRSITQQWWSGKDGWSVTLSAPYHPMAVTHISAFSWQYSLLRLGGNSTNVLQKVIIRELLIATFYLDFCFSYIS